MYSKLGGEKAANGGVCRSSGQRRRVEDAALAVQKSLGHEIHAWRLDREAGYVGNCETMVAVDLLAERYLTIYRADMKR